MGQFNNNTPKNLFHYTSPEGLIGIVQERKLRASNISLMNDSKEFTYATSMFMKILMDFAFEKKHENIIEYIKKILTNSDGGPIYSISLSENPDQLSQWRAYCARGGFSIGFECEKMQALLLGEDFNLVKCIYKPGAQEGVIEKFASKLASNINTFITGKETREERIKFCSNNLGREFGLMSSSIKHPSFEEECEWRFCKNYVYANHGKLKFKPGNGMLTPYFEASLSDKEDSLAPISEIYVAPHKNSGLSMRTLRVFLAGECNRDPGKPFIKALLSQSSLREI